MHALSDPDREFVRSFETLQLDPAKFDHRAHVRLAYAYLVDSDVDAAASAMRAALHAFIRHHGVHPSKYHETITRAWILAVHHFMKKSPPAACADAFIDANPLLLDTGIMRSHYSAELLFSEEARGRWVEPDLEPIPD